MFSTFRAEAVARRMCRTAGLSTLLGLTILQGAAAHEVQPSVADVTVGRETAQIEIDWVIEAPVAGIDLEGIADTNDAEGAEVYDTLRALRPDALAAAFAEAWPDIERQLRAVVGETAVELSLEGVDVPEVGNAELPRISEVRLSAALPAGEAGLVFGWEAALGPLVVREAGVENGYATFLQNGRLSDPIPRTGVGDRTAGEAFARHLAVGFENIVPIGLDHVLFALALVFLAAGLGGLSVQLAAFFAGLVLTLGLGALGRVGVPTHVIEPLIAASVVYVAIENVLARGLSPWRPPIVFGFGLIHGLGLAGVLGTLGRGPDHAVAQLAGFAVGAGLGLLAVAAAGALTLGLLFGKHRWYKLRVAAPVSVATALVAAFLVLERTDRATPQDFWAPVAALTQGGMPVLWGAGAALVVMLVVTIAVFATDSDVLRDWGGALTSFVAFIAVTGAFTALDYTVMAGLVAAWVVALRTQSIGGFDAPGAGPAP